MKNSKGFSLVEAIVIIAVIAVLAGVAVPSLVGRRDDTKLRGAISAIQADFEMARSRAIRENAFVAVLMVADGYSIFIDDGAGGGFAGNWVQDGDERVLCNRELPGGIQIDLSHTTFSGHRTRFNGRGYSANNGVLRVSNSNGKFATVDMNNRFGRITTY